LRRIRRLVGALRQRAHVEIQDQVELRDSLEVAANSRADLRTLEAFAVVRIEAANQVQVPDHGRPQCVDHLILLIEVPAVECIEVAARTSRSPRVELGRRVDADLIDVVDGSNHVVGTKFAEELPHQIFGARVELGFEADVDLEGPGVLAL
jgi:hypothetical protein